MRASGILMRLIAAGALSAGAASAQFDQARLAGDFSTQHDVQANPGDNEACFSFDDGGDAEVEGEVREDLGNGCAAEIRYDTNSFNSASGLALKGGKTAGTAKLTQSIFSEIEVELSDSDGIGDDCALEFEGAARPERCSVKASLKGTQVPDTEEDDNNDTVDSDKINVKCELGADLSALDTEDGTEGVQPPTLDQAEAVIAAFADRSDVKLGSNGKLDIKHDGVPDLVSPACD